MCRHENGRRGCRCKLCHNEDDKCDCGVTRENCLKDPLREEKLERHRQDYYDHREARRSHMKNYYDIHKEENKERYEQWILTHKEEKSEMDKQYRRGGNVSSVIRVKINHAKWDDRCKGRPVNEETYIKVELVLDKLKISTKCSRPDCQKELHLTNFEAGDPLQLSINRIDNSKPHDADNCEITCWGCNDRLGKESRRIKVTIDAK